MNAPSDLLGSTMSFLYHFQTLFAGVLAILAAAVTAGVIWCAAKLPIANQMRREKELANRRRRFLQQVLSSDLHRLAARARQAESTIRVVVGGQTNVTDSIRERARLKYHEIMENWEFMSLLPERTFASLMRLQRQVNDHNFDINRAEGSFGAKNFSDSIIARARSIQGLASALSHRLTEFSSPESD